MLLKERRMIHIGDFCRNLKSRWKQILLFSLLGMIVIVTLAFMTGRLYGKNGKADFQSAMNNRIANAKSQLTQEQIRRVEGFYEEYLSLIEQNRFLSMKTKPLLSQEIISKRMVYRISKTDVKDAFRKDNIKALIIDDGLVDQINESLQTDMTISELSSLIYVEDMFETADGQVSVLSVQKDEGDCVIAVVVLAEDSKKLQNMAEIVDRKIKEVAGTLCGDDPGSMIRNVAESEISGVPQTVMKEWDLNNVSIQTIGSILTQIQNNLSTEEKQYYNLLIAQGGDVPEEDSVQDTSDSVPAEKTGGQKISKKKAVLYAGIGFFITAFILLFYHALSYIYSKKLHLAEELKMYFNLDTLCEIRKGDMEMARKELEYMQQLRDDGLIGIVSSSGSPAVTEIMETLAGSSDLADKVLVLKRHMETDEDYQKLASVNSVILMEQANVSDMDEIAATLSYYQNKNIPVDGVFMVKE